MYVVVDLEGTCWDDEEKKLIENPVMEIIEIGAVKIDLSENRIVDTFQAFVKPLINPVLSNFCKDLTTITQQDVKKAQVFENEYARFWKWFGSKHDSCLASWGYFDKKQLMAEAERNRLPWKLGEDHVNISRLYREKYGGRKRGLSTAARERGIPFEGTLHRGIDDAKMGALIFMHMMKG